jgi:hypothetical protein
MRDDQVMLLDTCHAGQAEYDLKDTGAATILEKHMETLVVAAANADQDANDVSQNDRGHGLFAYVLANGLAGDARRVHEPIVTDEDLASYVRQKVWDISPHHQQLPHYVPLKKTPAFDLAECDPATVGVKTQAAGRRPCRHGID